MVYLQFIPLRVFVKVVSSTNIIGKSLKRKFPYIPNKSCNWFIVAYVALLRLHVQLLSISSLDDFSRKTRVYFLKHKSEAFVVFQEFKSLVEREYGKCIKTLRTNNAREYTKNKFSSYLSKNEIKHQRMIPYTY